MAGVRVSEFVRQCVLVHVHHTSYMPAYVCGWVATIDIFQESRQRNRLDKLSGYDASVSATSYCRVTIQLLYNNIAS